MVEPTDNDPAGERDSSSTRDEAGLLETPRALTHWSDTLFIGRDGLRPAWRLLVYFALREILYLLLGYVVAYVAQSRVLYLWTDLVAELAFLLAAVVPAFLMAPLERRRFGAYGLPRPEAFGKSFWVGAVWGFGAITVLMLAMHGLGVFDFGQVGLHSVRILKFACFWGLYFLLVGVAEEFYLRGYTQFTLSQMLGFWPAAIALSIAFGAIHYRNPGETLVGLVAAGAIGLFFCLTLRRTGSLWFAIGFHAAWDWGESYFYSVPDSGTVIPGHLFRASLHGPAWLTGGSVGPEGSVLLFALIFVLWIAFDRVYPEVRYVAGQPGMAVPTQV
jgi:membrane protease YdiL (CAAX protease family)